VNAGAPARPAPSWPSLVAVPALLLCGLAAAISLRVAIAASQGATSTAAGIAFAGALAGIVLATGWRARAPTGRQILLGVAGAAVLCAGPVTLRLLGHGGIGPPPLHLYPEWAAVVAAVAVAEEALLRGALWHALERLPRGTGSALVVTTACFALLHVPLYGWTGVPLDVAVGVWLGGLRMAGGGVAAPATSHALADLAAWWMR
jgi:membrane protease YdiL (CAAX protease family)